MSANEPQSALELWKDKLAAFQREEAIASDPAIKFQLKKQIEECKQKIEELEGTEGLPRQTVSIPPPITQKQLLMNKVALLVGVSEYQPGLQSLPSAIADVRAMQRVLQHPEMGGFDKVEVLTDPTTQQLRIAIYDLFAERSPEDLVLFYFSGHGVKDQNRNLYLTTPETTKSHRGLVVPPTAVKASYLQEQMTNSRSEHEVIILDCCYSGAIAKGLTAKDEGEVDIIAELGGKGRAILTSSTSVQSSFQQEGTLSIYTQYLVQGMETGAADLDSDGRISAAELHQYASKKVQQASPAMTPQFYPVEEGYRIYLARSPIDDPKLKYREVVQEIVQENQGEIEPLDRHYLDEYSHNLGISPEEVNMIETEVLEPFRQRQQKLQRYEEVFSQALQKNSVLTDKVRRKLKRLQKVLELRDEDVAQIEAQFRSQLQSRPIVESKPQTHEVKLHARQVFNFDVVTVNARGQKIKREKGQAQYFTEDLSNNVTLDLVVIPPGTFLMGTEDEEIERLCKKYYIDHFRIERPQHKVIVPTFFMGKYPITQAQWRAIASLPKVKQDLKLNPSNFKGDNRPVENISWYDAVEFCERLSRETGKEYRLPSEAEWEYACRAGTTTPFHFGETITGELANYCASETYADEAEGEYREKTTTVGSFLPNAFGLYDLHGNILEWCADTWHNNYKEAPTDATVWTRGGDDDYSPLRGGSWGGVPDFCRSAFRLIISRAKRDNFFNDVGFRVVCDVGRTV